MKPKLKIGSRNLTESEAQDLREMGFYTRFLAYLGDGVSVYEIYVSR